MYYVSIAPDPLHQKVLTIFSDGKLARLVGKGILSAEYEKISTPGECATLCNSMHVTKCLSFNYDFGTSGHCELLEAIEGHDFKTSLVNILLYNYIRFQSHESCNPYLHIFTPLLSCLIISKYFIE